MSSKFFAVSAVLVAAPVTSGSSALAAASQTTASSIIERNYPAEALARGEQGVVEFAVDVDMQANIDSCVVTKSSGYPLLDAATCDVIVKHAHFAPAESAGKRVATTRAGRMAWKLPKSHQANARLAGPPVVQTAEQLEAGRLICSKSVATGSVIKSMTYCLTKAEWSTGRYLQQSDAEKMMGYHSNHGCHLRAGHGC